MSKKDPKNEKHFCVEIAKSGRAACKKCQQKCVQGDLRIAKLLPNQIGTGKMKSWHHVHCMFEVFLKQRQTTKRIEGPDDVEGWELLDEEEQNDFLERIENCNKKFEAKLSKTGKKIKSPKGQNHVNNDDSLSVSSTDIAIRDGPHKDNCFREFRSIVATVSGARGSTEKIAIFRDLFCKGSDGSGFKGDINLWCKLLLPAVIKRVFNVQTKQLVSIFAKIFHVNEEKILDHLEQSSDVGLTIQYFFEENKKCKPMTKSTLTIHEIDEFLEKLTTLSKDEDFISHFKSFVKKCTSNDLKVVVRLIKHDLRMNAGAKHVFEGIHADAYQMFQNCRDIKTVINTYWPVSDDKDTPKSTKKKGIKRKLSDSHTNLKKKLDDEESKSETVVKQTELIQLIDLPIDQTEEVEFCDKKKTVPNYFENFKLLLEDGVIERHALWVRYFIAFGGTVLKANEFEHATHVLHLKDTISEPTINCVNGARHVIVEWIKDTVAKQSLQDYRPYTVRWSSTTLTS